MTNEQRFFYDHAGYSYDPKKETPRQGKTRCARELARAEAYAHEHGWCAAWEQDAGADASWVSIDNGWTAEAVSDWHAQEHECLVCVLKDADRNVLASLGGIWDADRNYGRVIEAELASEALSAIETEQRNAEACARLVQS